MKFLTILATTLFMTAPVMAKTITVDVNGLVCDFCAQSVKKVISKEDGVENVDVDLTAKTVTIDVAEGKDVTNEKITQLIKDSGYDITGIHRD